MNPRKSIVVFCFLAAVCLPTGLISPAQVQNNPPQKIQTDKPVLGGNPACPGRLPAKEVIDLCKQTGPQPRTQEEIELMKRNRTRRWFLKHQEVTLSFSHGDQVAWTCKDKRFKIVSIEGILDPDDKHLPPPPEPPFPFCGQFKDQIGKQQPKGTVLYSGPPVQVAIGYCYKYSFQVEGSVIVDPHIIVTDGCTGIGCRESDSHPNKCVFSHRVTGRDQVD